MLRAMDVTQDLKIDILGLKRELAKVREENHLLKVKIRKLQSEVSKRDRQIETIIDPRKSSLLKKIVSERGAMMIIALKERNSNLEKVVAEKDATIKRLQNDLQTKRLYSVRTNDRKKGFRTQDNSGSKCTLSIPYYNTDSATDLERERFKNKSEQFNHKSVSMFDINHADETEGETTPSQSVLHPCLSRRSLSADRTHFDKIGDLQPLVHVNNEMRAQYEGLSRDHLLSIIGSLKSNQQRFSPRIRKGGSPESDLERNELQCDTPHQEIQQLQNYFMDMLSEVDQLKVTISTLQSEQEKTMNVLKKKDSNIIKLANEIKNLKRPKSQTETNVMKPKRISSAVIQTAKKQTHKMKRPRSKSASNNKPAEKVEEEEDDIINICTYTEIESDDEKSELKIVHTRTMSIQTLENTPGNLLEQMTEIKDRSNFTTEDLNEEVEARQLKFSNLLQQMQDSLFSKLQSPNETKRCETEPLM